MSDVALSIRQPWAWLILHGGKDIENRKWATSRRGRILIHAGKAVDSAALRAFEAGRNPVTGDPLPPRVAEAIHRLPWRGGVCERGPDLPLGGIVGAVDIIDCIEGSDSAWFQGPHGFVLRDPRPLPFVPLSGKLGFFKVPDRGRA